MKSQLAIAKKWALNASPKEDFDLLRCCREPLSVGLLYLFCVAYRFVSSASNLNVIVPRANQAAPFNGWEFVCIFGTLPGVKD